METIMKQLVTLACIVAIAAAPAGGAAADNPSASAQQALFSIVSKLDADLFNTFNHCASPDQLQKHASYFAPDVEFYHDKGGVTWTRHDYIANTRKNVCGQFRRKLVGSLQVFPIKDFGAIEQGTQKFCWLRSGKCFGEAQFLILWHHADNRWVVTRVFSYGHHAIG